MIQLFARRFSRSATSSSSFKPSNTSFPSLIVERLYYAEGRHHPDHPLHGSHTGLGCW